ncbi:MAG: bifunctional UDP-N-acetylglucosamine pyrophosphorylase / glucosamine-phosphate N-acetyltransferase [Chloroflexota bacterium]|nr:bifunctional UDP-N-acetylglucosamine pyrophosphorylase / glucosamine-phosphate N-acetyltransferase [Chloroflexota bacterium]
MSQPLTAVILAAGHGTRMRSRTPKVLHPILGRPMVDWVLNALTDAGAKNVKVIISPHQVDLAAHLEGRATIV